MIKHVLLFLLVGWLISLAYFAKEEDSPGRVFRTSALKLLKYTAWTVLLGLVLWGLEKLFIYPF